MVVRTPFRSVAVYAPARVAGFSLAITSEVFGFDRGPRGLPSFEFAVCTSEPGPVRADTGLTVYIEHGLDRLREADLVVVLPWEGVEAEADPAVSEALRTAYAAGAIVTSCCTGSFALAAAGLLDGRRATTHWRWAGRFAQRYPEVTVLPEVLYIDEGQIVTGAGAARQYRHVPLSPPSRVRRGGGDHDRPGHRDAAPSRRWPGAVCGGAHARRLHR